MLNINKSTESPNYDKITIPVEFIVIHYTACDLETTLSIFKDQSRKVSSHLVIAENGDIYETVKCLDSEVYKAWHAGQSSFNDGKKNWEGFNDFSIGIELINLNGNIFEYTHEQYRSLEEIINQFKLKFKSLTNPERIIGHEQIAKNRGKVDPGWLFDWGKVYNSCYPGLPHPERKPNLPVELKECTVQLKNISITDKAEKAKFWQILSSTTEAAVKLSKK